MTFSSPKVLIFEMESEANTVVKDAILRRVKRLIDGHALDQKDIADRLGVGFGAFRQWGRRTIPPHWYLKDFCDLMGCSIEYLLTGKEGANSIGIKTPLVIAESYEALISNDKWKARGFLQVIFDQEDGVRRSVSSNSVAKSKKNHK